MLDMFFKKFGLGINTYERPITKEDVLWAYDVFLHRTPRTEAECNGHLNKHKNLTDLVNTCLTCEEFTKKNRTSEGITISDYPYHPKSRDSLKDSYVAGYIKDSVEKNENELLAILHGIASYADSFANISVASSTINATLPYWSNPMMPPLDGFSIYYFLAKKNPRYYVECGSGNSTKFAAQSIKDNNLRTKIISIDPAPRAEVDLLCETIYRLELEEMDLSFFHSLTKEDIFLVDNSHRSFTNSDVTVFFTEILPILPDGLLYTLHDIFLPYDYNKEWDNRFYNEQYLLASYLIGGAMGDIIVFPTTYIYHQPKYRMCLDPIWEKCNQLKSSKLTGGFGGLFWMQKGTPGLTAES